MVKSMTIYLIQRYTETGDDGGYGMCSTGYYTDFYAHERPTKAFMRKYCESYKIAPQIPYIVIDGVSYCQKKAGKAFDPFGEDQAFYPMENAPYIDFQSAIDEHGENALRNP